MKVSKADFALHKEILEQEQAKTTSAPQQELADFFDNAVMCLCWIAADGHIARVNQAMLDLLHSLARRSKAGALSEFTNIAQAQEMLARLAAGETFTGHELRLHAATAPPVTCCSRPTDSGTTATFIHARCFLRDVTRKLAEQNLQDQEARIRSIVETAVDGIIVFDDQGLVESFNPAAEQLFGYEHGGDRRPEHPRLDALALSTTGPTPSSASSCKRTASASSAGREVIGRHKDGASFPIELAVSEMHARPASAISPPSSATSPSASTPSSGCLIRSRKRRCCFARCTIASRTTCR